MAGNRAALGQLPYDILFLIIDNLDTARDHASLSRSCRRLHDFMQCEGWRAFSRRCFPGVFSSDLQNHTGPNGSNGVNSASKGRKSQIDDNIGNEADGAPGWRALADSLTWQSRAWDRRAMAFQALLPRQDHIPRHKRPRPFPPALAVHFQTDLAESGKRLGLGVDGQEMLVIGAGEDIVARYRRRGRKGRLGDTEAVADADSAPTPEWHVLDGQAAGFCPGYDDVRAVSIIDNALGIPRRRGILAGRENGHVSLLSAENNETFGKALAQFIPQDDANVDQSRIYSIDVSTDRRNAAALGSSNSCSGLAAVTTPSDILFYLMPGAESGGSAETTESGSCVTVHPVSAFSMGDVGLYHTGTRQPFNARWMEAEGLLAVALGAGPTPLRYLTMTPTGAMELTSAYTLPELMAHYDLKDTTLVLPTSLTPVAPSSITGGNGHLVLSGWRDGTCRLQDLRTASPYDLIYQDNVLGPQYNAQALLMWGAERFITGNQESAVLKIFDLRWPRRYFHTDALPCSPQMPRPTPPMPRGVPGSLGMSNSEDAHLHEQPRFLSPSLRTAKNWPPPASEMPLYLQGTRCCDVLRSIRCRWHRASRNLFYRSSSSLFLQVSLEENGVKDTGVHTLARASSDLAPANFYAGLNNCVVESLLYEDVVAFESPRYTTSNGGMSGIPRTSIWTDGGGAPYFGYPKAAVSGKRLGSGGNIGKDDGHFRSVDVDMALIETGDNMARPNVETRFMWLPRIRNRRYDFDREPRNLFDKTTKLGMRDYDRRGPNASACLDEITRIKEWKASNGQALLPEEKVTFRDQQLHRLDFGFQDYSDFQ
ncbi:hypothetical protein SEUCBS140593_004289 [Sporothrix eucalyptigena]|uniref:F-box domain-containing protein n=1 Tax=Sporothrix eucalyptigena TaxID=1812306 RepID=A0ABP0BN14_9PEZI